jgi:hypothetical protein
MEIFYCTREKRETEKRRRGDEWENFTAGPGKSHAMEQFQGINYDFSMRFSTRLLV